MNDLQILIDNYLEYCGSCNPQQNYPYHISALHKSHAA